MMMQMLAAGGLAPLTDNLREPDEDNPRGYYEFEPVKQVARDASWLADAEGKAVKMVYRLLYDLPQTFTYRVIFMRRNVDEIIASQEVMLQRSGKAGERVDGGRLAEIYGRQLRDVGAWLEAQPNFSVLSVEYRDVLNDPESVTQAVNEFLAGRLDVEAMLQVPDRSLYRQRRSTNRALGTGAP
jgi:hypothetical protein